MYFFKRQLLMAPPRVEKIARTDPFSKVDVTFGGIADDGRG